MKVSDIVVSVSVVAVVLVTLTVFVGTVGFALGV